MTRIITGLTPQASIPPMDPPSDLRANASRGDRAGPPTLTIVPQQRGEPVVAPLEAKRPWPVALLASATVHAAVIAAMMVQWAGRAPSQAQPPAAMVVDLAVMPSSPQVPPNELPPGPQQQEAAATPRPVEKLKFDPPPQTDPTLKPDFAVPPKDKPDPVPTQSVAKVEARATTAPQSSEAPVKANSAAPVEGSNVAPPSDAEQAWEGRILAKLERNKRYPSEAQRAGQQDTVFLRLAIDRRGRLVDAALRRSAGYSALDSETLALARRAGPYPVPPASMTGDTVVLVVPVEFYIKKRP
ncbi:energy transducer TonB [Sphingomonas sp. OTU376]|uniref:energy transducer TonB n=1 Tax=Sphingomonas sp. OTU376 TaxID=3043863 RepID=UPI00313EFD9E